MVRIAVVIILIAIVLGVYLYNEHELQRIREQELAYKKKQQDLINNPQTSVRVPVQDLKAGTRLTEELVETKMVPFSIGEAATYLPQNLPAYGLKLIRDVPKGEPFRLVDFDRQELLAVQQAIIDSYQRGKSSR